MTGRLALCLLAPALTLAAAGIAFAQTPPPFVQGEPETVYSDAQRSRDQTTSRRIVEAMLAPAFSIENQYAKWKRPVCPHVYGLTPAAAWVIEHRIRQVAQQVGAPVDRADPCIANIGIIFTVDPQATLDSIAQKAYPLVLGGSRKLTVTQPVQAWYATFKTDYNGQTSLDLPWEDVEASRHNDFNPNPSKQIPDAPMVAANMSKLHTGQSAAMGAITVLVDSKAVTGMTLGSLADYFALLTLAQAEAGGHCQIEESIANLMLRDCDAGSRPQALSHVDVALLTALYRTPDNPELLQKQRIVGAMRRELEAQFGRP